MSYKLRDYQEESVEAILQAWRKGAEHAIVGLATGTGKTLVMGEIAKRRRGNVLILAHMERLLEQMRQKMLMIAPSSDIGIVGFGKAEWGHRITLGGFQTLLAGNRLAKLEQQDIKTVIVDECHHTIGNTWYNVIKACKGAKKLGVTATYLVGSGENIRDARTIYGPLLYQLTLPAGILDRWLADIDYTRIHTGQTLRDDQLSDGDDFDQDELGLIINLPDRNDFIVHSAIERGVKNRRCLAFCATVAHSEELAACFRARGVKAASFTGLQNDEQCKKLLDEFARGEINVLTSCKKLGEGVDIELVDMLLLCSKTRAQSVYLQQIGRGTRFVEGIKELCYVLDYVDNGIRHELEQMSLNEAIGLPPTTRQRRLRQALEEAIERDPDLANRIRRGPDDSSAIITRPISKDQIVYEKRKLTPTFEWTQTSNGIYIAQVEHSTMALRPREGGNYDAYLFYKGSANADPAGKLVISNVPTSWAKSAVEKLGRDIKEGHGNRVDPRASWRFEMPSPEQIAQLRALKIYRIPDTKGEAADILNARFTKR